MSEQSTGDVKWTDGLVYTDADREAIIADLGREPRGVFGVGSRTASGHPLVLVTAPRLPDGTPFPTTFYLTDPVITVACSTLEAEHYMVELTEKLAEDEEFAAAHQAAHEDYISRRNDIAELMGTGEVTEIAGISAGGLPGRVKCLHALVGHSLVAGPGVNLAGDIALEEMRDRGLIPSGYTTLSALELSESAKNDA